MVRFTIITLTPVALLAASLGWGGPWAWAALVYITLFTFAMDKVGACAAPDASGPARPDGRALSIALGAAHFPLLYGGVWTLAAGSHTLSDKVLIFLALSLFLGQVSNSNAHELIHSRARPLHQLGVAIYASLIFGHHASAHLRVHHVYAATDRDPNSARLGESFYRYALRAWAGSCVEGWRAENARGQRRSIGAPHPYIIYATGAAASLILAIALGGGSGAAALLGMSLYAQLQLLLSDYVQHYGLRRRPQGTGYEAMAPRHSWNAPHGFSAALMLNAPRHSDHHTRPARSYPALELDRRQMPLLPHSLPVMAVMALVPPLWRKVMDRRAKAWAHPG